MGNLGQRVRRFLRKPGTAGLGAVGLKRPTATWTYLVQDNPFGTDIDRALRSVGRLLRGSRR